MTVIVATKDTLVCDGQVTSDNEYIMTKKDVKIIKTEKGLYGASGNDADCVHFLNWAKAGEQTTYEFDNDDWCGIKVDKSGVWIYGKALANWRVPESKAAIGCGMMFAMGAIAAGADALTAVKLTCKHVEGCGGTITTLKL